VKFTHLVEGMATLRHDMRLLSRKTKAKGEGFETDGAFLFFVRRVVARYHREWGVDHGSEGVRVEVLGMGMGMKRRVMRSRSGRISRTKRSSRRGSRRVLVTGVEVEGGK